MSFARNTAALFAAVLLVAPAAHADLQYTGVNLAGAEFGSTVLPGTFNTNYTYPTAAEVDYYVGKGMNTFRLPFRWERLQPTLNGALNAAEFARMDAFVDYATGTGAKVILDPHNYARYYPPSGNGSSSTNIVGSAEVPHAAFGDFWGKLAGHYKGNGNVIFGLMNEPNSMPTEQWVTAANTAIAAIRNVADAGNTIMVPGNAWTGAYSWGQSWYGTANAQAMLNIVDPDNNYVFEVHQYLDDNSAGDDAGIVSADIGVTRLQAFTQWLKANNRKGFLGEFAVANNTIGSDPSQIGDEAIRNMLAYMEANDDVWTGWTWWAGGPWWGDYMFSPEPTNLGQPNQTDKPIMGVLQPHLVGVPEPTAGLVLVAGALALATRRRS